MFGDVAAALRDRQVPVDRAVVLELIDVCDLAAVALNEALDGFVNPNPGGADHGKDGDGGGSGGGGCEAGMEPSSLFASRTLDGCPERQGCDYSAKALMTS